MTKKPTAGKPKASTPPKTRAKRGTSNMRANLKMLQQFAQAIEAMRASMATRAASAEGVALENAEDVVADAWDAPTARARIALAKKAIGISPRCADAFTILAQHENPGSDEALDQYRKAVAAGEAAIGPDGMTEMAGEFWGFHETRPYMRARHGLADCLRRRGEVAAAADEYRAMLKLNPNDNQGIRYELMRLLQHLGAEDELSTLLASYPEDSAFWTYTNALAEFRRQGATDDSRTHLQAALSSNPHVPPFLLGKRKIPKLPDYYAPGEVTEAVMFAHANADDWAATEGALAWLSAHSAAVAPRAKAKH